MERPIKQRDVKLSKSLSWLLRHGADKEGITMDEEGFADIPAILRLKQFKTFDEKDIMRVVEENDKKRFSVRFKNCWQIRANQGHSIKVDDDALLIPLTEQNIPHTVYHGTYSSNMKKIEMEGLSRMKRNHIHFSPKLPSQGPVISGMRSNCEIAIGIDSLKAIQDGFKFYKSDNNVILCPGNDAGIIPSLYFKEIWQLKPLQRIL